MAEMEERDCTPEESSPEARLRRYLYITNERRTYVTGDPDFHGHYLATNVPFVRQLLTSDNPTVLLNIIENAAGTGDVLHRETLFYVLAYAARCSAKTLPTFASSVYAAVSRLIRDDVDLFKFVKQYTKIERHVGSGVIKVVRRHYLEKEPLELARSFALRAGYHTWKHKDLIRLSHVKTDVKAKSLVIDTLFKSWEDVEKIAGDQADMVELVDYLRKAWSLRRSKDEDEVLRYLRELKLGLDQVPGAFNKSTKIWEYLVEDMELRDILSHLVRMYKIGFLKAETPGQLKVTAKLTDADLIRESRIHPVEVYMRTKWFENGGRPKDPKFVKYLEEQEQCEKKLKENPEYKKPDFARVEPIKCPIVSNALNKMLKASYHNVEPTGKRFMITLDVSDKMDTTCVTSKGIPCIEAATILTMAFLKSERHVIVAVFNGETVTPVMLDKSATIAQCVKKLRETTNGAEMCGTPMEWARTNKKPIDVFINMDHELSLSTRRNSLENPKENLKKYKATMNMSLTKLVLCSLGSVRDYDICDPILTVCGFDESVPKVIDAFVKCRF